MDTAAEEYKPIFNQKNEEQYSKNYCEENVFKLCEKFEEGVKNGTFKREEHTVFGVFITNQFRQTYVKNQAAGDAKDGYLVMWDYHVILVHKDLKANKSYVYDFDSKLNWPCKFEEYFIKSLLKKYPTTALQTMYRVVDSQRLIEMFASNRDHMLKKVVNNTKLYASPPPKYPCIVNKHNETNNLFDFYLDVSKNDLRYGESYKTELQFNEYIKNYTQIAQQQPTQ